MEADPRIGVAQGKILSSLETDVILSTGHTIDYLGFPLKGWGWQAKDNGEYDTPRETFDAWNACMIVRRSVLDEVGAFDPEFFYANEDVDLGWRIRLAGYRIAYVPAARIWHRSAIIATSLPLSFTYYMSRNVLVTLFKNYGLFNLLRFFTVTCALSAARGLGEMVLVNPRHGWTVLKSVGWLPLHVGYLMRERRRTQQLRRVSDSELMRLMQRPELNTYLGRLRQRRRTARTGTDLRQLERKNS
jgi:cellulose synthase/poly-beta-1,6-N-acetylglucosamine synthase-like glycosyltransferase